MKILLNLAVFLTAGALGYGAIFRAKSRRDSGGASASQTRRAGLSPQEVEAQLKRDLAAAGGETGAALRERLAANFKLLGIDPFWAEALAADSAAGFPALMDKLASTGGRHRALLELMLLDRWVQLDPEGGVAYFKAKADAGKPIAGPQGQFSLADDGLANFIRQWGMVDFEKAAAKAGELGEKTTRRTLREKAKLDPAGFLAWASKHPEINPLAIFTSGSQDNPLAVARLAEMDLDRVLAWAKDAPTGRWATELAPALAEKLAQRSPDEAIAWAKTLGSKEATSAALAGVARALADTNPTRALDLLKEMGGGEDYRIYNTYRDVIQRLGLSNPDRALEVVKELPRGTLRDQVLAQAMGNLMAADPAKALAFADKLGSDANTRFGVAEVSVPKSPVEARRLLDLAEQATDTGLRQQIVSTALMGWANADQRSLAEYLASKPDNPMLEPMKDTIVRRLAEMASESGQPIDKGLAEAAGMKPEMIVEAVANRDPELASTQLAQITDEAARLGLVGRLAQSWSGRDRGDAIDWAANLASPEEQAAAFRSIADGWMAEDSHQASAWIATLAAGKPRDAAVLALAHQVASTDPDLSWQWGMTMTDPALRTEALGNAAQQWNRLDGTAFRTAMEGAALNDTERAAIMAAMQAPVVPPRRGVESFTISGGAVIQIRR